jgi:hypothetical protein
MGLEVGLFRLWYENMLPLTIRHLKVTVYTRNDTAFSINSALLISCAINVNCVLIVIETVFHSFHMCSLLLDLLELVYVMVDLSCMTCNCNLPCIDASSSAGGICIFSLYHLQGSILLEGSCPHWQEMANIEVSFLCYQRYTIHICSSSICKSLKNSFSHLPLSNWLNDK